MIRAYKLECYANKNKIEKIKELAKEYRKASKKVLKIQLNLFFKEGKFNKNLKISLQTKLSARYLQTLQYQIVSMLDSYLSNRINDFKDIVLNSNIDEDVKIKLLYINKYKKWFNNNVIMKGKLIEDDILKLSRKIIKRTFKNNNFPNTNNIQLHLDGKVAEIKLKKENDTKEFDYWVKLSTLEKGKPIYIPIKSNRYFEEIDGKLKNFVQINLKDTLEVVFFKDIPKRKYIPKTDKIALDLGLVNLFVSNKGDLFGRKFIENLKKYDEEITKLMANLQRNKIKPTKSKRYRRLIHRMREWLKNEINRIINRIIKIHKPKEIVIEKLNFQNPKLSKRMNRLLQRFGKGVIKDKLKRVKEEFGIKIKEVNPSYTSQTCSNCGYISPNNRKSQSVFICEFCGKRQNSDVNAAKNILLRSSEWIGSIYVSKRRVLEELLRKFFERHRRVCSCPLIVTNPYFKERLVTIKPFP